MHQLDRAYSLHPDLVTHETVQLVIHGHGVAVHARRCWYTGQQAVRFRIGDIDETMPNRRQGIPKLLICLVGRIPKGGFFGKDDRFCTHWFTEA